MDSGAQMVLSVTLTQYCSGCHNDDLASGALGNIGDIDALITSGLIVPGNRDESAIFLRMENGSIPPAFIRDNRPTQDDIDAVGAAIDSL